MSEKGLCVVCGLKSARFWLSNPCKHEVCQRCLTKDTNPEVCSGCNSKIEFLNCPNKNHGCAFRAAPKSWKDHVSKCLYACAICPYGCDALVPKTSLLSHMDKDCPLRIATCQYCAAAVYHVEVTSHEESCPEAPMTCPYCLLEGMKLKEFSSHAEGCPKTPRPCPLQQFGCDFTGIDADMDEHLVLKTHAACFKKVNQTLQEDQEEITRLELELRLCKSVLEDRDADLREQRRLLEISRSREGCTLS